MATKCTFPPESPELVYIPDMTEKSYVLILNWNGWQDTIECLESVFRLEHPSFQVVVLDNDSSDGSLDHIRAWADGALKVDESGVNPKLTRLISPPVKKPIPYALLDKTQAEAGGGVDADEGKLILIQTGDNLGFAGGNNVGLRYIIKRGDYSYVWLLNNDTVVEPGALSALTRRVDDKKEYGICGSTVMHYHQPDQIQALGGATYNKVLGRPKLFAPALPQGRKLTPEEVESRLDYVYGASMLITRDWLSEIGLMSEDYFLYFEELDWIREAKGRYIMAWAEASVVYHKRGVSIGINRDIRKRSYTCDYYYARNRLAFTRKHIPIYTPFIYLLLIMDIFRRIAKGQLERAWMILYLLLGIKESGDKHS